MSAMEPCTVLVVEDEVPILNNVVRKLESMDLPLRVVGTAFSGQEAVAFIEGCPPHIVLTDIRMPGMDGLELCKYLVEHHPAVKTVVLSGYGEFEYAQAAIRCQVSDYLLKPVNPQKLYAVMERLCGEVDRSRRALQRQCLARQLSGGGAAGELPYQFEHGAFGLYLICLGNLLHHVRDDDPARCCALWETAGLDAFLDGESLDCWWLIEEHNPNERMLLIAGRAPTLAGRLYGALRARLAGTCAVNLYEAGREVAFGEIWSVARKLRESLRRTLVPCTDGLFVLGSTTPKAEVPKTFHQPLEAAIRDRAVAPFKAALHSSLKEFQVKGATQRRLEGAVQELLLALEDRRPDSGAAGRFYESCCEEIAAAADAPALYALLETRLLEAFARTGSNVPAEGLAAAVKTYIDEHYWEEITMELLAEQFHFSESYIARLFRTQYGAPPVKYLLQRRIEQARALIAGNDALSFGAVAEMVGYPDQHYFSRLFRITTGMSPSEYRASVAP